MVGMICGQPEAPHFVGRAMTDKDFAVASIAEDTHVSGGSTSEVTEEDRVFNRTTGATVDHGWQILADEAVEFESLDEAIATVDTAGHVARVSDGTVGILVHGLHCTKRLDLAVSREGGQTVDEFLRFADGSLAKHMTDQIDDYLDNVVTHPTNIFSSYTAINGNATRNTSCWAAVAGIDLTPILTWNSYGGRLRGGIAVSAKHLLCASHYGLRVNDIVAFTTIDNTKVTRDVSSVSTVSGTDIQVVTLDEDLPESISFAKVLPADWSDYLPSIRTSAIEVNFPVPIIALNQNKRATVNELKAMLSTSVGVSAYPLLGEQVADHREPWYIQADDGDSGSPSAGVISGELIALTAFLIPSSGPNWTAKTTEINAIMSPASLTAVDLSSYTNFS